MKTAVQVLSNWGCHRATFKRFQLVLKSSVVPHDTHGYGTDDDDIYV